MHSKTKKKEGQGLVHGSNHVFLQNKRGLFRGWMDIWAKDGSMFDGSDQVGSKMWK